MTSEGEKGSGQEMGEGRLRNRLEVEIRRNKWNGEEWRKSVESGKRGMKEET